MNGKYFLTQSGRKLSSFHTANILKRINPIYNFKAAESLSDSLTMHRVKSPASFPTYLKTSFVRKTPREGFFFDEKLSASLRALNRQ